MISTASATHPRAAAPVHSTGAHTEGRRSWAGIVMARSGGQWIVGAQVKAQGEPELEGARLLSCDGVEAEIRSMVDELFAAEQQQQHDPTTHGTD